MLLLKSTLRVAALTVCACSLAAAKPTLQQVNAAVIYQQLQAR